MPVGGGQHAMWVGIMMVAAAAGNAVCSVNRYYTFRAGTYDLVIFDQAVRSYSHFRLPVAIAKGVHNGFGPHFTVLGDHFSPVLALLAPLYWIHDGPPTLLMAAAVLFAAAIAPLWVFTRRELGTVAAYCVAAAYALSWPIAQAVAFDFHEVTFAPVILAVVFERLSAYRRGSGRWWQIVLACLALLCVKEDMGLLVAGLGLGIAAVAVGVPHRRREALGLGAALTVGGLLTTLVISRMLIPAFGGRADYYWTYNALGRTVPAALWHVVAHPIDTIDTFVRPGVKVHTMLWLLALAAFAPLASPYLLAVLPPLAERMLSDAPNWWGTDYHYNAFLVVPVLCAGVDGIVRIRRRWRRRVTPGRLEAGIRAQLGPIWAAAVLVIAIAAVPAFAFGTLADASSWRRGEDLRAAASAAARVPSGVLVEAASPIGPHLSGRTRVLLWDRTPRWAPWVVADVWRGRFPFCALDDQRGRVQFLQSNGYRVVFEQRGYVVLSRRGAVAQLTAPPAAPCR
jgi:uncharacterized membrane protein